MDSFNKVGIIKCVIADPVILDQPEYYQIAEINGELFAGSDIFDYPENKGAVLPLEAFVMPNEWVWHERYLIREPAFGEPLKPLAGKYTLIQGDLAREKILEILNSKEIGHLAMIGKDYPYCIPMNHVYNNGRIYMHCAKKGLKQQLIKNNAKVCYEVDGAEGFKPENIRSCHMQYKSALFFGTIEDVQDREEKYRALIAIARHYGTNFGHAAAKDASVLAIHIDYATARDTRFLPHKERKLYICRFV